ncbi:MAG: hypothetical protein ACREN7_00280 [Candidatus Dormibacteria bacterium]
MSRGITLSRHNPGVGIRFREGTISTPTEEQRIYQVAAATVLGGAFGIILGLSADRERVGTVVTGGSGGNLSQVPYTPPGPSCGGCPACQG